jgi:hypothetical protein
MIRENKKIFKMLISDKAIMKEIMHQRNSSIENTLAHQQILPDDITGQYQDLVLRKH